MRSVCARWFLSLAPRLVPCIHRAARPTFAFESEVDLVNRRAVTARRPRAADLRRCTFSRIFLLRQARVCVSRAKVYNGVPTGVIHYTVGYGYDLTDLLS